MQSVLVLNATYQPLSIVSARRGVQLIIAGKASALDQSNTVFHSSTTTLYVPYVILLKKYVKTVGRHRRVPFSRNGVLVRDGGACVYCGAKATTIDHVIPQAAGGTTSYENCVAACLRCNSKKADHSLKDLGWSIPDGTLKAPSTFANMLGKARGEEQAKAWSGYIRMFDPSLTLAK